MLFQWPSVWISIKFGINNHFPSTLVRISMMYDNNSFPTALVWISIKYMENHSLLLFQELLLRLWSNTDNHPYYTNIHAVTSVYEWRDAAAHVNLLTSICLMFLILFAFCAHIRAVWAPSFVSLKSQVQIFSKIEKWKRILYVLLHTDIKFTARGEVT